MFNELKTINEQKIGRIDSQRENNDDEQSYIKIEE